MPWRNDRATPRDYDRFMKTLTASNPSNVPTINDRVKHAMNLIALIHAAAKGADGDSDISREEVFAAIAATANDAHESLYWIACADATRAPAPTDDERVEMASEQAA